MNWKSSLRKSSASLGTQNFPSVSSAVLLQTKTSAKRLMKLTLILSLATWSMVSKMSEGSHELSAAWMKSSSLEKTLGTNLRQSIPSMREFCREKSTPVSMREFNERKILL